MPDDTVSFGRLVLASETLDRMLALEVERDRSASFESIDTFVAEIVRRSFNGERVATITRAERPQSISLDALDAPAHDWITEWFAVERQQARGAWFLPDEVRIDVGVLNLPHFFGAYPDFAHMIAADERITLPVAGNPEALAIWAALEPLCAALVAPLILRGPDLGKQGREKQLQAWAAVDAFYAAIGLKVDDALGSLRYGSGWSTLRAQQQVERKRAFLAVIAHELDEWNAARFRAYQLHTLVRRYYEKAKKGPPARRQVLVRAHERILSAYFGGDWLAFLAYLGEDPHPDERVATTLPETRLFAGGAAQVDAVAAEVGLPSSEIERMLGAFWGTARLVSPVEERVQVLRDYWWALDKIHAAQRPGMTPLWGLVDDLGFSLPGSRSTAPYHPGLYRDLLPLPLLESVERLWGTSLLPRWPDRMVTTLSPHARLAEAWGPALRFWHGCALTAWFVCEGPFSRTDLPGLATYYRREVAELAEMDCGIDAELFEELRAAEARLGPPEPRSRDASTHEIGHGLSVTMTLSTDMRRAGFEYLRDIITRYRRSWAAHSLDHYLQHRWDGDLRPVATEFSRLIEVKGKPPTPKQFAKAAEVAANHWFGGDLRDLYGAIGEKIALQPSYTRVVPPDPIGFAWAVFHALGGGHAFRNMTSVVANPTPEQLAASSTYRNLEKLAELSGWYLQLEEALSRPPTLQEFGRTKFEWASKTLADDVITAWEIYTSALATAKQSPPGTPPSESDEPGVTALPLQADPPFHNEQQAIGIELEPEARSKPLWRRLLQREPS